MNNLLLEAREFPWGAGAAARSLAQRQETEEKVRADNGMGPAGLEPATYGL